MSKTPVSILQELMVKKNLTPTYDLLSDSEGIGTHSPIFYYRVTADGIQAIGKARSKKEAKHEAARLVLEKLTAIGYSNSIPKVPPSPVHSSTPDPTSPQKVPINAIGMLADLCAEKNIPAPDYQLLSDVGPAHLRVFTIECTVGTMSITATDLTKKKARQCAAHKMLQRLIDTLPEEIEEMRSDPNVKSITDDTVLQAYNELSLQSKKKINWGLKISEYPKTISNLMDEKDIKYEELWKDTNDLNGLEKLLEKLDVHFFTEHIKLEEFTMTITTVDCSPPFTFVSNEKTEEEATAATLKQLLRFLKNMSK